MPKKIKLLDNKWISASATHNYFNDPLLDYYKYTTTRQHHHKNHFKNYLSEQGDKFESEIVKLIGKNFKMYHVNGNLESRNENKAIETFEAMKKGYELIVSGVLHNNNNKTFGVPDLIVRSDVLNKLVKTTVLEKKEINIKAPKLKKFHYRIVDIKYMTLLLKCDGKSLLNGGLIPAYKSQLNIYNQALGILQGYTPGQSYLLGRRWVYNKCGQKYYNNDCFDKLGVIDYHDKDQDYINLTTKALNWIKECKSKEAKKWNVTTYPLENDNLYPNMSNVYDERWRHKKTLLAKNNNELTDLWQVGKKNRLHALQHGVYQWKDKKCCSKILNVGGKTGQVLDEIIKINKGKLKIKPKQIKTDLYEWREETTELFIDFEFKNAVYDQMIQLPIVDTSILIFMIGVGYMEKGKWQYKEFTVKNLTEQNECKICFDFIIFIQDLCKKFKMSNVKAWHWSNAEPSVWKNALLKYKKLQKYQNQLIWCDMLKLFQEEPIVIKGCLNFKLKNIANAMYNHGYIKTTWVDGLDGQQAMIQTIEADKIAKHLAKPLPQMPMFKSIIKYNEIDVKVLQEIIYYLRNNH